MSDLDSDLLIVGGGLAGLAQALLLEASGWKVGVLERGDGQAALEDPRSIALSDSTRCILEAVGVWPQLEAQCAPITQIDVSQRGIFGFTRMRASDEGLPALGYVVSAGVLAKTLRERVEQAANSTFVPQAKVLEVQSSEAVMEVKVRRAKKAETVATQLLIAADGAKSTLRDALGLEAKTKDYGQSAVITSLKLEGAAPGQAYERFTEEGPIAVLPHPDGDWVLIWALPQRRARQAQLWSEASFCQELQCALGRRVGRVQGIGTRRSYPLAFSRVRQRIGERCVLIGDAAHSFHPVAAQGLNLTIRDAAWLAQRLCEAKRAGEDPGSSEVLRSYARLRSRDAQRVAGFTDFLARGFLGRNPVARGARALALLALDGMPQFRTRLVRFGMGADLPKPDVGVFAGEQTRA